MSLRLVQILALSMFIFGCSEEHKEASNDQSTSETESSNAIEDSPKTINYQVVFCDCLEEGNAFSQCEEEALEHLSADELIGNGCYQRPELQKAAQDMCDCINSIQQVSLKCDELQRSFDEKYSTSEQSIIQAYFDQMDCSE